MFGFYEKKPNIVLLGLSGEVCLDVDGVGDSASVLEGCVRRAVDEPHCAAVGVLIRNEVQAVAPLPEVRFVSVGLLPCLYCRY